MGFETAAWRAVAVFRLLALAYAVVAYARTYDEYLHPVGGWVVLALMALWTVLVVGLLAWPGGRTWPVAGLDLAVAFAAVVATRYLDDPDRIADGAQTLPVVWAAAPVLVFAIRGGWVAGVGAAAAIAAADLVHRGALTVPTANNIVLLFLAGAVVGYAVELGRRGERSLARALMVDAATRERERLSRRIHDDVLQVLAMVGRRGQEVGGPAAELGRLAAEQEQALRALVSTSGQDGPGDVDLRALLATYASSSVTVSTPAQAVPMSAARAREVAAAVGAALTNVAAHAGAAARAWVLLEHDGHELVVSVRDDGRGFEPARLVEARDEGRLGVASSIEGRVRDLGGTAVVESSPGRGTEVELRVPLAGGGVA